MKDKQDDIELSIIKVKKRRSNKERKSPISKSYSNYLKNKKSDDHKKKGKDIVDIKINVIKKNETSDITKKPEKKKEPEKKEPEKKKELMVKKEPVITKKPEKKKNSKKRVPRRSSRSQISIKKQSSSRSNRKNRITRTSNRVSKKRRANNKSRRVSFRCYPQNKKKNLDKVIDKVNTMSDDSIKKELLKEGIEIKGNKKQLLKDIYMFSAMGGIKIHKE